MYENLSFAEIALLWAREDEKLENVEKILFRARLYLDFLNSEEGEDE